MFRNVVMIGVVSLLAGGLIGGSAVILLRPEPVEGAVARGWQQAELDTELGGLGSGGQGQGRVVDGQVSAGGNGNGNGVGVGNDSVSGNVRSDGTDSSSGNGAGQGGTGTGAQNTGIAEAVEWEIVTGEVIAIDHDITVRAADGDVLVGLGNEQYRQDAGFVVALGDTVSVQGYTEDGEFKAGSIENMTTGQSLVLRTDTGRPLWAGNGQRVNQRQDI